MSQSSEDVMLLRGALERSGASDPSEMQKPKLTDEMLDAVALRYLAKRGFAEAKSLLADVESKLKSSGFGSHFLDVLDNTVEASLASQDEDNKFLSTALQPASAQIADLKELETSDEVAQDLERALHYALQLRCDYAAQTLNALFPVFITLFIARSKLGRDSLARKLMDMAAPFFEKFSSLMSATRSSSDPTDLSLAPAALESLAANSSRIRSMLKAIRIVMNASITQIDKSPSASGHLRSGRSVDNTVSSIYPRLLENDEIANWIAHPRWSLAIMNDTWDALFSFLSVRQCSTILRLLVSTITLSLVPGAPTAAFKLTDKDDVSSASAAAASSAAQESINEGLSRRPVSIPALYPTITSAPRGSSALFMSRAGQSVVRHISSALLSGAAESQSASPGLARNGYIPAVKNQDGEVVVFPTSVPTTANANPPSGESAMAELRVISKPPHIVASTLLYESELLARLPIYWGLLPAVLTEENAYVRMLGVRLKEVQQIRARYLLESESEQVSNVAAGVDLDARDESGAGQGEIDTPVSKFSLESMLFPSDSDQALAELTKFGSYSAESTNKDTENTFGLDKGDFQLTSMFITKLKRRIDRFMKLTLKDTKIVVTAELAASAASASAKDSALQNDPSDTHGAAAAAAAAASAASAGVLATVMEGEVEPGTDASVILSRLLQRPKVPMPNIQMDRGIMLQVLADLRRAVALSQERLPDCALLTMLNDYGHCITSVTCTPDMSYVIAGLQDSTMRVWHFAPTVIVPAAGPEDFIASRKRQSRAGSIESDLNTTGSSKIVAHLQTSKLSRVNGVTAPHLGVSVLDEDWPNYVAFDQTEVTSNILSILSKSDGKQGPSAHPSRIDTPARGRWAPQLSKLIGHSGAVTAVAITPDQQMLISGGADARLNIWYLSNSQLVSSLPGHSGPIWTVSVSNVGNYIATGSQDGTARLWMTEHTTSLRVFVGHLGPVRSTAFHPNSSYIATGSDDHTVRIWDMSTGACVRLLLGYHRASIRSIAFSPDGRLLASGAENGSMVVWDLPSGHALWYVEGGDALYPSPLLLEGDGNSAPIQSRVHSGATGGSNEDEGTVAKSVSQLLPSAIAAVGSAVPTSSSEAGEAGSANVRFARPACPAGTSHSKAVTGLSFSSDCAILASSSADGSVKLWRAYAGPAVTFLKPETTSSLNAHPYQQMAIHQFFTGVDIFSTSLTNTPLVSEVMSTSPTPLPIPFIPHTTTTLHAPPPVPQSQGISTRSQQMANLAQSQNAAAAAAAAAGDLPPLESLPKLVPSRMQTLDEASEALSLVLIKTFPTKSTPVWYSAFTPRNLLLSIGVFKAPSANF